MQPVMIASTATHIYVSSTNSAVPPVTALEDNTMPQNPVVHVPPTSDDSATAHIPVPSTSSTAPNLADQSDDDTQQLYLHSNNSDLETSSGGRPIHDR